MSMTYRIAGAIGLFMITAMTAGAQPAMRTVGIYLTCDECVDGELDSVRALGRVALPLLRDAASGIVADSIKRNIARSSAYAWKLIRSRRPGLSAARARSDSTAFVNRNVGNFFAGYESRAARAIVILFPADAAAELRRAMAANDSSGAVRYRREVRIMIDSLRRSAEARLNPPPL